MESYRGVLSPTPRRIVLDPSFVLRARGIDWMQRARVLPLESSPLWASESLMNAAIDARLSDVLDVESQHRLFAYNARFVGSAGSDLPLHRCKLGTFVDAGAAPGLRIASETFAATLEGGVLVSRRLAAMDLLVRGDHIDIMWRGPRFYDQLRPAVESLLPEPLASALLRRSRYLAIATIIEDVPTLIAGDNGWSTAR